MDLLLNSVKKIAPLLICCSLLPGCRNQVKLDDISEADSTRYPLLIDGGKKMVYQFGRMTADKGLKLYLDTVAYPATVNNKKTFHPDIHNE
jgi:hypothetical protein